MNGTRNWSHILSNMLFLQRRLLKIGEAVEAEVAYETKQFKTPPSTRTTLGLNSLTDLNKYSYVFVI